MSASSSEPLAGWYLFLLGAALGMTTLLVTAYATVSPRWLRWLLFASAALVAGRYLAMAAFAVGHGELGWVARRAWLGSSVGLTFPGAVALDQLIRHPLMTPKKLLKALSPFLVAYAAVMLAGQFELALDPHVGAYPRLIGWARPVIIVTQSCFVLGFAWLGLTAIQKLPMPRIRPAILGLMAAYSYLGVDGLLVTVGHWYFRPFLFSEMVTMAALWYAYHTVHETAG